MQQTITVPASGNTYVLNTYGEESMFDTYTDYIVQPVITPTPANTSVVGYMQWDGNGTTNFTYLALNYEHTNLGAGANLAAAVAILDAWLVAEGVNPL